MGMTCRVFLLDQDDGLYRLPNTKFERMLREPTSHRLPRFAGARVRMAEVVVELVDRRAIRVIWTTFGLLTFDDEGCFDPRASTAINGPAQSWRWLRWPSLVAQRQSSMPPAALSLKEGVGRHRELSRALLTRLHWGQRNARDYRSVVTDTSGWTRGDRERSQKASRGSGGRKRRPDETDRREGTTPDCVHLGDRAARFWPGHLSGPLPAVENSAHLIDDEPPGFAPILACRKQVIVGGLDVADVCDDGKAHGLFVESLCPGTAPHPPAIPETGMLRDFVLSVGRTVRKQFAHALRKPREVLSI